MKTSSTGSALPKPQVNFVIRSRRIIVEEQKESPFVLLKGRDHEKH